MVILALVVSLPVCTALAAVGLRGLRLIVSVLASQAVLHGLFSLFPASGAQGTHASFQAHAQSGHGFHGASPTSAPAPSTDSGLGGPVADSVASSEVVMILAHLAAALVSIAVLRRGEMLAQSLIDLLSLRTVRVLLQIDTALGQDQRRRPDPIWRAPGVERIWRGSGPCTVRGPPVCA